ncbi:methylated-DNA--[protein]-cysteine S-methyltransferase [Lentisphaerota bacterium WC36G]|nr:methylated-DNA--[protein]-cysteine S-methyltransferase [Lentisphaerae bacterium WC36]
MSDKIFYTTFKTTFCNITLVGNHDGLTNLEMSHTDGKRIFEIDSNWIKNDDFFVDIKKQLCEYFAGKRTSFTNIKLNINGTDFQKKVWNTLQKIDYGAVVSYKTIAEMINKPKASRAVGMANSKNKIPIIIPCHRIVGSNGQLTGFAHGLQLKKRLLNLERGKENVI